LLTNPVRFGPFLLQASEYRLTRNGQAIALSPRPFDLLVALVTHGGRLVTRDELLREVWKDAVVEQSSLNAAMSILRQALGEDAATLIETVPGRGYRFIAPIAPMAPEATPVAATSVAAAVRVAIVDDHAVVRMGVRALIERTNGFTVVGEAGTLDEGGELVKALQPDLLVLDLMMGGEASIERLADWRTAAPGVRVIVLSMHHEEEHARQALAAGAHGYVMKSEMLGELAAAIAAVLAGEVWLSTKLSRSIVREYLQTTTPRT